MNRERTLREERRLQTRLRQAKLKHSACLEDLDDTTPRGLDRGLVAQLATGQWIREGLRQHRFTAAGRLGMMGLDAEARRDLLELVFCSTRLFNSV